MIPLVLSVGLMLVPSARYPSEGLSSVDTIGTISRANVSAISKVYIRRVIIS